MILLPKPQAKNESEDIAQLNRIDEHHALDALDYKQTMAILLHFCANHLHRGNTLISKVSARVWQLFAEYLRAAVHFHSAAGNQDYATFEHIRIQAWENHDKLPKNVEDAHLMRLIICCLYDEEAAEFSTFGAEAVMETFMSVLHDLNPALCRRFAETAIQHMQAE